MEPDGKEKKHHVLYYLYIKCVRRSSLSVCVCASSERPRQISSFMCEVLPKALHDIYCSLFGCCAEQLKSLKKCTRLNKTIKVKKWEQAQLVKFCVSIFKKLTLV